MTAESAGQLVLVLLGFATAAGAAAWSRIGLRIWAPTSALLLAAAALAAATPDRVVVDGRVGTTALICLAGALAVVGGGPVTSLVFALVDGPTPAAADAQSMARAGELLRGGAWIGVLERAAVFASLVAGWPEGLAIALGLKGLGRYPELRNQENTGAAERFIIGTFTSVLWAAACAGVARLLL